MLQNRIFQIYSVVKVNYYYSHIIDIIIDLSAIVIKTSWTAAKRCRNRVHYQNISPRMLQIRKYISILES